MTRRMRSNTLREVLAVLLVILCVEVAAAENPARVTKLDVTPAAGGAVVRFEIDKPADVTVRIVGGDGKVVRHLAAGMVGLERAARPFAARSLSQSITWDGRDDSGKKVDPAGCKVTVRVGMRARFDRFILSADDAFVHQTRGPRDLIFSGLGGEYYVTQAFGIHVDTCRVFDKDGKFVRSLFPYALKNPGVSKHFDEPSPSFGPGHKRVRHDAVDFDGDRVPVSVAHADSYYITPRFAQAVVTTDGHVVGTLGYPAGFATLTVWTPEGLARKHFYPMPWHATRNPPKSVPEAVRKKWRSKDLWKLAPGKDGDFYLADGIHNVVARFRAKDLSPVNFTHSGTQKLVKPRAYIGEIDTPGSGENHFNGPDGVALDDAGNILVLDGNVVKTYTPEGRFVDRTPRAQSSYDKLRSPIRDGGLGWKQILKMESAKPGSSGVPAGLIASGKKPNTPAFPHFIKTDSSGRLYVEQRVGPAYIVTDVDGKKTTVRRPAGGCSAGMGYMCVDSDDNWYATVQRGYSGKGELHKYGPDGKRLKFGDKNAIVVEDVGKRGNFKGVFVVPGGDIYVVAAFRDFPKAVAKGRKPWEKGEEYLLTRIDVYSPTGELKKKGLVRSQALSDVVVDSEGNVYTIEGKLRYKSSPKRTWPPPFLSKEEAGKYEGDARVNMRKSLMQRLVKFSPTGGVLDGENGPAQLWSHPGVSGVSPLQGWGHLQPAQMSLDADERIWIPDTYNYSIKAVDKAGNLMLRVGKYGSEDCRGGGGDRKLPGANIVVDPEIPLARPHGMAVHGDYLFITDMMSHRVVRCRLEYADKKEAVIR